MGLFDFFRRKKNEGQSANSVNSRSAGSSDKRQQSFIQQISKQADELVSAFNERYNGDLDYSEKSLVSLDRILNSFSAMKHKMDEEVLQGITHEAGAYLFEVVRRNYGGKYYWLNTENQPILVIGQPEFEICITAYEKVRMRIANGAEDSIPYYVQLVSQTIKQAKPGDRATIV